MMIIIIDGYNILKTRQETDVTEQERNAFLKMLGSYAKLKKHKLVVVFDGGPYEWVHKEKINGMRVIYSGRHETADEVIMQYLDKNETKEILLVSTDHELGLHASGLDIPSINSDDFFSLVYHALKQEPIIADEDISVTLNHEGDDLDTLMEQGSLHVPIKKEDIEAGAMPKPAKTASRKEKRLYRILKKL